MNTEEKIIQVTSLYYKLGYQFLNDTKYIQEVNLEELKKFPWFTEFLDILGDIKASDLVINEDAYLKDLGVYDEIIFKTNDSSTGIHYILKDFLFYYLFWLLQNDLLAFIENAKLYRGQDAKFDKGLNALIYQPVYYDEVFKRIYRSTNTDGLIVFFQFMTFLRLPYGLYKIMNFNSIENHIEKSNECFDFKKIDKLMNDFII